MIFNILLYEMAPGSYRVLKQDPSREVVLKFFQRDLKLYGSDPDMYQIIRQDL